MIQGKGAHKPTWRGLTHRKPKSVRVTNTKSIMSWTTENVFKSNVYSLQNFSLYEHCHVILCSIHFMCTIVSYINTERVYIFMYITCIMGVWAGHSVHNFTMPLYSFKLVSISSVCHSKKIYFQVLPTCSNIPTFMGRTRLALSRYILKGCPYSIFFFFVHFINHLLRCPLPYLWCPRSLAIYPGVQTMRNFPALTWKSQHFIMFQAYSSPKLYADKNWLWAGSFHSNMYFICASHHPCNKNLLFVDLPCQIQTYPKCSSSPLIPPPPLYMCLKLEK